jgi:hypothetical protein
MGRDDADREACAAGAGSAADGGVVCCGDERGGVGRSDVSGQCGAGGVHGPLRDELRVGGVEGGVGEEQVRIGWVGSGVDGGLSIVSNAWMSPWPLPVSVGPTGVM